MKDERNIDLALERQSANPLRWSPSLGRIVLLGVRTKVLSHRSPCPCKLDRRGSAACSGIFQNLTHIEFNKDNCNIKDYLMNDLAKILVSLNILLLYLNNFYELLKDFCVLGSD